MWFLHVRHCFEQDKKNAKLIKLAITLCNLWEQPYLNSSGNLSLRRDFLPHPCFIENKTEMQEDLS